MAKQRTFDPAITNSVKSAAADSFADNIKMIDIEKLVPHKENFYSMTDIELLADDIERQGLKNNLVVREGGDGYYTVISGHRRRQALIMLINDGRVKSRFVPCYINPAKTADEEMQDLIMLNATSRVISDSEMIKQYELLKRILETKKANGENVRIREKIAEILGISNGKVSMIESIVKNSELKEAVESGETSIFKASAQLKKEKPEALPTLATEDDPPDELPMLKDEEIIKKELKRSISREGIKSRIEKFLKTKPTNTALAAFLKKEYGYKGGSGEYPIEHYLYDYKGIHIRVADKDALDGERCLEVTWSCAAKYITEIFKGDEKPLPTLATKKTPTDTLSTLTTEKEPPASLSTLATEKEPPASLSTLTTESFPMFSGDIVEAFENLDLYYYYDISEEDKSGILEMLIDEIKKLIREKR